MAPEHTKRLYRSGGLDSAHIRRLPTELIEDFGDGLFRRVVVATNEHRRPAAFECVLRRLVVPIFVALI